MQETQIAPSGTPTQYGDTDQFAALNRVKGPSVRARFCRTGSYFGVRPIKLLNGRLDWPLVRVEAK
jgi:hypothetical protein